MSGQRGERNGLVASVHGLLDLAEPILQNPPGRIAELRERLDGPLRVAIAGKVKAGKSTLLNALVGEKVAPTDAGECTRIVTWYRNSHLYRVTAVPYVGAPEELPFRRTEAEFEIALGSRSPEQLHYLDVEWPSERLRELILIDTPGLSSLSEDVSRRTEHYLSTDEEGPGEADAVIYLMRHLHPMDLSFLEAFKDHIATRGASVNSIAVLSRADEIGACRPNALGVAERVAQRYRHDPRVQTHCQAVLPVAGLIAEAAATLREDETTALRTLAALDREVSTEMLRSAERFASLDDRSGIDINLRRRLLDRLGLFGVRLAVELLISGKVTSAGDLSRELEARSGIGELRRILTGQFAARAAVLKARSTLASTLALAELHGGSEARVIRERVRDIQRSAHELVEIRLLTRMRAGSVGLDDDELEARRLLGDAGPEPHHRLGLPPSVNGSEVRDAAIAAIGRWRQTADDPLLGKEAREIAEGVIRSAEAIAVARS
jgi:predicted GTPase